MFENMSCKLITSRIGMVYILPSAWVFHEKSSINLDKKNCWDPSAFMTCTLPYSMLKNWGTSFKNLYKYFMIEPGLVTFFLPTSKCIFLKEHFACIVLFYVHCSLQPQLSQVQFLQDLFSNKTILNHFTKMARWVICPQLLQDH